MKIRIISDIHHDPQWSVPFILPEHDDDNESILVVAGDAGEQTKACELFKTWCNQFRAVVYVMGNHEYYRGSVVHTVDKIIKYVNKPNLHVLDMGELIVDDIVVLGATLWTDMFNSDPFGMWHSGQAMNDYRLIRTGSKSKPYERKLRPVETVALHMQHLDYIKARVAHWKTVDPTKKIVVATHHAPSERSVAPRFMGNGLNCNYYSVLDEYIMDQPIVAWIHGHMHNPSDYMIGDCRIICNARGYHSRNMGVESTGFNPDFYIEID